MVAVTGAVKQKDRHQATKDFQEKDDVRVMLANYRSSSNGLTWTAADIAVFLDRHWTPAINAQAEDRLHRMAEEQRNHCKHGGTWNVEEYIEKLLEAKKGEF